LENIGISMNIDAVSPAILSTSVLDGRDYDVLLTGLITGMDPDPYAFWHSSQSQFPGLNVAQYTNRNVDNLLEKARTTTDIAERGNLYVEFQDLLASDLPAVFLYQSVYTYAPSAKLQNIKLERIVRPADRFANVESWYIRTKNVIFSKKGS